MVKLRRYVAALGGLVAILAAGCSGGPANQARAHAAVRPCPRIQSHARVAEPASLGGANLVSYRAADFESGSGNWVSVTNARLSTVTKVSFLHRASLQDVLGISGGSSFELGHGNRISVQPGRAYRIGAYFEIPPVAGRTVAFDAGAYNRSGKWLGWVHSGPVHLNSTGKWQYASEVLTMPVNACYVLDSPRVTYSGGRAGEVVHMDEVLFTPDRAAVLIGADAGRSGAVAEWMTANKSIGALQLDKIFYPRALPVSYRGSTCAGLPKKVVCLVAYKTPTVHVGSFVSSIPAGRTVVMIFHQEPEGDFPSGQDFVGQFEHQSALIRRAANGAPNMFVADDAGTSRYQPGYPGADCSYIPPAAYTDFYFADHYEPRPTGLDLPKGQQGGDWARWLSCVEPMHKPIGLAEYGLGTCSARGNVAREQALLSDSSYLKSLPAVIRAPVLIWNYWWVNDSVFSLCKDWLFTGTMLNAWRSVKAGT